MKNSQPYNNHFDDLHATHVLTTDHHVTVTFDDGRTISVPVNWYPRIAHGTPEERANIEIWDDGLYWPDLNADMSFRAIFLGKKSGEGPRSFARWLSYHARGEREPIPTLPLPSKSSSSHRSRSLNKTPVRTPITPKRRSA
jgi:Protein of unknown function (DUF2442)